MKTLLQDLDKQSPKGFKLRHILKGHTKRIVKISWSPDGLMLATPSDDMTIRIWNLQTGNLFKNLKGHDCEVGNVAWSPNSKLLASGSTDRTICIWDINRGNQLKRIYAHRELVRSLSWSPDGNLLASGSDDFSIKIWEAKTTKLLYELRHFDRVTSVLWSPNSKFLASASDDSTITIWDINKQKAITKLMGHSSYVYNLAWSPDGKIIASPSADSTIRIWNFETGKLENILEGHSNQVLGVSFSSCGRLLASKSYDESVRIWRCDSWEPVEIISEPSSRQIYLWHSNLAFHPIGNVLATFTDKDTAIRIWDVDINSLLSITPTIESIFYTSAKIVLAGESGIGKTCLARALLGKPFEPQESTHGINIFKLYSETKEQVGNGHFLREIFLWDLAGQIDYQIIHQLFLDDTVLGIVLFDPSHPDNPFRGVSHWDKALMRIVGKDCVKLLVAGRIDRGYPTVTIDKIEDYRKKHGYLKFIETSSKTGKGVEELHITIQQAIPWEKLPITTSPSLWKNIREFLLKRSSRYKVLTTISELQIDFKKEHQGLGFTEVEFSTVINHAQAHGLLWRLSFGNFILLQPELLNNYAAAIVRAARKHPKGLGCVSEREVLDGMIDFEDMTRLSKETEINLLYAVIELFLERELAFRGGAGMAQLIFPSKFNRQLPEIPKSPNREVAYNFSGSVEEIYTTLAIRLSYSEVFELKDLWKNVAEFRDSLGNVCGFLLEPSEEGHGIISIFFDIDTSIESKVLFLLFVHEHLYKRALKDSVIRERIYRCINCGEEVTNKKAVELRLSKGLTTITCQFCDNTIELIDVLETKFGDPELLQKIKIIEKDINTKKRDAIGVTTFGAKKDIGEYDVFLAYNNLDKSQVEKIAGSLKHRGLNPWFDKWNLPPGRSFQEEIEKVFPMTRSVVVFVGPSGIGPWEEMEVRLAIQQFVKRKLPVIPVLLPGVKKVPTLPLFLQEFSWLRLIKEIDETEFIDNLIWGITGKHPKRL